MSLERGHSRLGEPDLLCSRTERLGEAGGKLELVVAWGDAVKNRLFPSSSPSGNTSAFVLNGLPSLKRGGPSIGVGGWRENEPLECAPSAACDVGRLNDGSDRFDEDDSRERDSEKLPVGEAVKWSFLSPSNSSMGGETMGRGVGEWGVVVGCCC